MREKNWAQARRAARGSSGDAARALGLCRRLMHAGDLKRAAAAALLSARLERLERGAQKRKPAPAKPPRPPSPEPAPVQDEPVAAADHSAAEDFGYAPRDWRNSGWR